MLIVVLGCRLNEIASFGYAVPAIGPAPGPTSISSRALRTLA